MPGAEPHVSGQDKQILNFTNGCSYFNSYLCVVSLVYELWYFVSSVNLKYQTSYLNHHILIFMYIACKRIKYTL